MSERISMADKIAIGLSVAALVVSVVAVALPYRTVHHLRGTVVRAGWFDGDGMQFDGDVIISNSGSVDEVVLSVQLLMSANLETRHSTVLGTVHGPFVVKPGTAVPIRLAHTLQGDILLEAGAVTDAAVVIEYGVAFTVLTPEARAQRSLYRVGVFHYDRGCECPDVKASRRRPERFMDLLTGRDEEPLSSPAAPMKPDAPAGDTGHLD